jgi:hypothetical protein
MSASPPERRAFDQDQWQPLSRQEPVTKVTARNRGQTRQKSEADDQRVGKPRPAGDP